MTGGLLVFGIAGYAFVTLTGRVLPEAQANLAIAFYFLVNVAGPGIFYALEQVTSRSTSRTRAAGQPLDAALRRARRAGAGLVLAVTVLLGALAPVMLSSTLHGDWGLYAELLATPLIMGAMHLVRGALGGMQRFDRYAGTLVIEGLARIVFTAVLAAASVSSAWIYGVGYLAASVLAMLAGAVWVRAGSAEAVESIGEPEAAAVDARLAKSLAALAVATLFAQLLPNIAPLAVSSRLARDSVVALAFGQAAVVARIPLLLFFPVQTMLLPSLTAAVTRGEIDWVRRRIRLTLGAITALGALGAVVFVLLGPWVLRTFFATKADLDTPIMVLLAVSTVVLIAAYAVQPALVALGWDRVVTAGWMVGSVVTLGMALLPGDAVNLAAWGQVVGPALTLLVALLGLRAGLRALAQAS